MKKRMTAIALVICLLAIGIVGATMSYFTDKETSTNTFTMGKGIFIDLSETSEETVDNNGVVTVHKGTPVEENGEVVGYTYDKVLPGLVYSKKPTVMVERESGNCWLVATVEDDSVDAWVIVTATVPTVYDFDGLLTQTNDGYTLEKKTVGDKTTYYFYYNGVKAAGAAVKPFTQVTINPALTQEIAGEAFDIVVNAYAIQKEGFTSAKAAYNTAFAG